MAGNDEVTPGYGEFARFYDCMMDDPLTRSAWVVEHIDRYMPEAASLLELGCGTGSVLAGLRAVPSLTGLDLSPAMLTIARAKVPAAAIAGATTTTTRDPRRRRRHRDEEPRPHRVRVSASAQAAWGHG
jgi:predicted TPR repeat methyltransferase